MINTALPGHDRAPTPTRVQPPAVTGPRTPGVSGLVRRRLLLTFFVLSCLFSWWPAVVAAFNSSEGGLAGFGPFVAAVVVLALTQGRSGVKALLASMIKWRVPPRAYLAAIGIPIAITALAILLTIATGAVMPSAAALGAWTEIPLMVALMLLIPGMGGAWEEPGFRGFALGRLEQRYGLSSAPLLLGAFWVVWHLPLFLNGAILPTDVVVIMAVSVVIAAVYHSARDSVLIAMLLHATNNAVGGEFASQLFTGADAARLGLIVAAVWALLATAVIIQRVRSRARKG